MPSFLEALLHHTKHYESPTSFWKWSAYASVAAVLRDNVWIPDGDSRLYPNVYILFVAGSAQRKGRPVALAEQLVHAVNNVKIISGRSSIQAILVEIGQTETDSQGKIKKGGSAIFFAPELAAGIVQDEQSIQILTDIYDYKPTGHTTNLIGRSKSKLDKLIFSMLGASNEELLKSIYTSKAVRGGLLGRTFIIAPDEFRPGNAFPAANEASFFNLINLLREISLLTGTITFDWEAEEFFRAWYVNFRDNLKTKEDRTGILGRLHTNAKKLSVILAAIDKSIIIYKRHIELAIDECLQLTKNYNMFTFSSGKSTIAEAGTIVLEALAKTNSLVDRRVLIRDNWMHFDPEILDKTIAAFEAAAIIRQVVSKQGVFYELTDKGKEIIGKAN